jgi:hypothetical protein
LIYETKSMYFWVSLFFGFDIGALCRFWREES